MKVGIKSILKSKLTRIPIVVEMSIKLLKKYSFTVYFINSMALFRPGVGGGGGGGGGAKSAPFVDFVCCF